MDFLSYLCIALYKYSIFLNSNSSEMVTIFFTLMLYVGTLFINWDHIEPNGASPEANQ